MAKNKVGKPLKFPTPEELKKRIEEYFSMCDIEKKIPTITELAYHLDTTRKTLLHYENSLDNDWLKSIPDDVKLEYVNTIKKAKARIEMGYEQALFNKNTVVGAIFTLKNNFGWTDKQEIEHTNRTIEVTLTE